jgi:uncharacterized protein
MTPCLPPLGEDTDPLAIGLILRSWLVAGLARLHAAEAAERAGPAPRLTDWASKARASPYPPATLAEILARYRGDYHGIVRHMLHDEATSPLQSLAIFGWETLAYMLLGMAALKTGFLTGDWSNRDYRRVALIGFGIGVPTYAVLAWLIVQADFSVNALVDFALAGAVPVRPLMIGATAALVILLTRPGGAVVERIAAAGRAAFTNYLGTSLLMTALFYGWGLGQYGHLSRIELWIPVVVTWTLMLIWSKPWLDRFRYGPFEWLWRSLARWQVQPMRRQALPA